MKNYPCRTCSFKTNNRQALKWHIKFRHQGKLSSWGIEKELFKKPKSKKLKSETQLSLKDPFDDLSSTGILLFKYENGKRIE